MLKLTVIKNVQRMFLIIALFSISFIIWNLWLAGENADKLPIQSNSAEIATSFSYFITSEHDIEPKELDFSSFVPVVQDKVPYELDSETYWVLIAVENKTDTRQHLTLHTDNAMLDALEVFEIEGHSLNSLASLRDKETISKEQIVFPHANFDISPYLTANILVKVRTLGPPNVPLKFYHAAQFAERIQLSQMVLGAFIGIILMIASYNIVLFLALNDKVYLVYIGYLLSALLVSASLTGFGYYVFPYNIQLKLIEWIIPLQSLLVVFLILFTLFFLRYDVEKKPIYKTGLGLIGVILFFAGFSLTLDPITQAKYFFTLQPIFYVYAFLAIGIRLRKDFSWAKFYFISWAPLLFGAAIQPLLLLNKIDYSFMAKHALVFAIVLEITFMAFALAERVRRNEKDRLNDVLYHPISKLPRKLLAENTMQQLILENQPFDVFVMKPEQIDTVGLYINDRETTKLLKAIAQGLHSLFEHNDAVMALNTDSQKVCLLDNNAMLIITRTDLSHQSRQVFIQSIQTIISKRYQIGKLPIPLAANVGIASFPEHGDSSHVILNRAQQALNQASFSQHRWSTFELESYHKTEYLLKLAADIKNAIENDEFEIYHQPQIDLKTNRVCGSESLIRWQHATEGFIAPPLIIEVAEDMGLINQLTLWVIEKALTQHQTIIESGFTNHMISINISGKDFVAENFCDEICSIFERHEIPPEKVIFELTESAQIIQNEQAKVSIEQLSEMGITISIDDFGTGYSSMAYITTLPFNELKIDRQFVEDVMGSRKRRTIAETTTKMAKGLGLEVVAEGINSATDERAMREFGCDIGQGYYYAKPMSVENYIEWLEKQITGAQQSLSGQFIPAADK